MPSYPGTRLPSPAAPSRTSLPALASLPRPLAFVLGAGGSHGAVQVGQLRALHEHGVRPDLLVGASVGALNAAVVAACPDRAPAVLARVWTGLRAAEVFPRAGRPPGARVSDSGLRRLVAGHVPGTFADLDVPLHVVAARRAGGAPRLLGAGDLLPALLASCAIPGLLPAVEVGGELLVDGGIRHDLPVAEAFALGAASVVALPTTRWPWPIGYRSSAPVADPRVVVLGGAARPGTGWTFRWTTAYAEQGYRRTRQLLGAPVVEVGAAPPRPARLAA